MTAKFVFVIPIALLMAGCGAKEKEMLQSKVDSLSLELETSQKMAETLTEVGAMMDSIDASRQLLRVNMVEGTTFADYKDRMKDINGYVKDTQKKIDELEGTLKESKASSNAFSKTIKKLRADLETKTKEITDLQEQVEKYRNENQNLITTVGMQEAELTDKQAQI
ncbi:MAG TPA: hypothetical protein VFD46_01645, partial [Chryseolinea sp.]|nr:hypothetical protein [Chryseolinea sp.]